MSLDNKVTQLRPNQNISRPIGHYPTDDAYSRHGGGNGGGNMLEARVAKLESDVEYIKRDLAEVKSDIKSVDSRLSGIETSISSAKTTIKASAVVVSFVFAFCAYIFGSYVSKILDALNGLVLK
ncbi:MULTISPECIES: hemolysin XhlA [Escherichia]|uniref:hemolysin XhlA n=1 Tax=Escherichia TaxID=561 RepID=UPI001851CED9|nr:MULTISPECIES: hemolysin XhlA [Escherichia]EJZ0950343.1 hemolysin XhlA [Escherichia albertii]MBB9841493.1 hemolysin XhlA [Escherichia coli]MBS9326883.1 hemolysin XhlA [Escherichia coli]MCE7723408.1 hemolysin XhlA [Escherichia albertii]MCE7727757.1 hemolysin XhlA [Escherichia albertii]